MFENMFRNIDDVLWKEAGCTTEFDCTEQTSWMLILKYLDDLERERSLQAELKGQACNHLIDSGFRWSAWAAPKTADGQFDHGNALTAGAATSKCSPGTGRARIVPGGILSCSPTQAGPGQGRGRKRGLTSAGAANGANHTACREPACESFSSVFVTEGP